MPLIGEFFLLFSDFLMTKQFSFIHRNTTNVTFSQKEIICLRLYRESTIHVYNYYRNADV